MPDPAPVTRAILVMGVVWASVRHSVRTELRAMCTILLDELAADSHRHAQADETAIDGDSCCRPPPAGRAACVDDRDRVRADRQGAKRLAIGDRVYDYRAGQYLVASVDLPITGHYTEASPARPRVRARPAPGHDRRCCSLDAAPGAGTRPTGLGVADASPELLDAVSACCGSAGPERPGGAGADARARDPVAADHRAAGRDRTPDRLADSSLTHIGRAVRWITEHYARVVPRRGPGPHLRHERVGLPPDFHAVTRSARSSSRSRSACSGRGCC